MDYRRTWKYQLFCAGAGILLGIIIAMMWYAFEYNDMNEMELGALCSFLTLIVFGSIIYYGDELAKEESKRLKDLQELYETKFQKVVKALDKTKEKLTEQQTKYNLLKEKMETNGVQQGELY